MVTNREEIEPKQGEFINIILMLETQFGPVKSNYCREYIFISIGLAILVQTLMHRRKTKAV